MATDFTFDADLLTVGDLIDFEEVTGVSFDAAFTGGTVSAKAMAALAWIMRRRDDPAFTFTDARNLTLDEVLAMIPTAEEGEGPNPPLAAIG